MTDDHVSRKAIEHSERIADEILRRRAAMDAKGNISGPLYVFIAEQHASMWQHAIQLAAIETLGRSGQRLALGMEFPHKLLSFYFRDGLAEETVAHEHFTDAFVDPDNRLQYQTLLVSASQQFSAKAHHAVCRGIPVQLNDAAKITGTVDDRPTPILRLDDGLTQKFMKEAGISPGEAHPIYMPPAVAVRNRTMMHHVMEHAERTSARIYIQIIGGLHMAGLWSDGTDEPFWPYHDSMMGLFDRKGVQDYVGVGFDVMDGWRRPNTLFNADLDRIVYFDRTEMESMCDLDFSAEESLAVMRRVAPLSGFSDVLDTLPAAIEQARTEINEITFLRAREIGRGKVISRLPTPDQS